MFFYRAWIVGTNDDDSLQSSPIFQIYQSNFSQQRWGYLALLVITLMTGLCLNISFLSSFMIKGLGGPRKVPNVIMICLAIRDLFVALILIPIAIDWYVVNAGYFTGGFLLCKVAGFMEHYLMAEYPLLLITFAIVLLSRKFPDVEEAEEMEYPMEDVVTSRPPSIMNASRQGSYSRGPGSIYSDRGSVKPPSVIGSADGYRNGRQNYRPRQTPEFGQPVVRRPGSVTGSIEGRLASARRPGTRVSQLQAEHGVRGFTTSSPLPEVDENESIGDVQDLWESASLEYPGNNGDTSPHGWEFMNNTYEEPHYHTWHLWLTATTWLLALSVGVPAAFMVKHDPGEGVRLLKRPGCYIPSDPFRDVYSYTINDPGFNFNISIIIVMYFSMILFLAILTFLACCRKTRNNKYRRYLKILTCSSVVLAISRAPNDILQLKGLVEAAMGFRQLNTLPYESEYEVLLIWSVYLPIILHPIIYFSFVSEFREGALLMLRKMCGCKTITEDERLEHYKEDEILETRSSVSKTQVSNIL